MPSTDAIYARLLAQSHSRIAGITPRSAFLNRFWIVGRLVALGHTHRRFHPPPTVPFRFNYNDSA